MTQSQRRNLSPEDRYEYDRELAIEAEYQAMLEKPLSCWIDDAPTMRLGDAVCDPVDYTIGRAIVRIDLDAIFRAIAEQRAESFAEQSRNENQMGLML